MLCQNASPRVEKAKTNGKKRINGLMCPVTKKKKKKKKESTVPPMSTPLPGSGFEGPYSKIVACTLLIMVA